MDLFKKKGLQMPEEQTQRVQFSKKGQLGSSASKTAVKSVAMHSENERDKKKLKENPASFDQMLEKALKEEGGPKTHKKKKSLAKARPESQNFLKKKDRYDPLK